MSKEGAQIWLEDCRQKYRGVAGSNILFDVPDETLYIDPEGKSMCFSKLIKVFVSMWNSRFSC